MSEFKGPDFRALFSGPMVCALLADMKIETRRLNKPPWDAVKAGDRIWVRENFTIENSPAHPNCLGVRYLADGATNYIECQPAIFKRWNNRPVGKLHPSLFMPRIFSRITLSVTNVRQQLLKDITHEDAIAEGVRLTPEAVRLKNGSWRMWQAPNVIPTCADARSAFLAYWDYIYRLKKRSKFHGNPAVVAITFNVHKGNIDG